MKEELISIIVPVHNQQEFLPHCIAAITAQTYRTLEIILVDDGSTDDSGRLCDEFAAQDNRVQVIHQENQGAWSARNAGQEAATGSYLFFPDGDDYFHPDFLRTMHRAINSDGFKYDLAVCRIMKTTTRAEFFPTTSSTSSSSSSFPSVRVLSQKDLMTGLFSTGDITFCPQWNKLYRAEALAGLRSRAYVRGEDRDFQMRLFLQLKQAVLVDIVLYYWYQHPYSLTHEPGSVMLSYSCRVKMDYLNYKDLSERNCYRSLLLHDLYKHMALWKAAARGTKDKHSVWKACTTYEKATRRAYLTCPGVNPFTKWFVLTLLHCPALMKLGLKLTHNG